MTYTTSGGEAWNTLVETLTKTDLRTLRQALSERLTLMITLLTKSKSHLFCNTIRRDADALSKHRYTNEFTNANKFTKRFSNNITDKLLDGTLVQPETALHIFRQ